MTIHWLYQWNFCLEEITLYDFESSSSSSDDSDDDIDVLFLDMAFAPKRELGKRLNLEDIWEEDCEQMFRCWWKIMF